MHRYRPCRLFDDSTRGVGKEGPRIDTSSTPDHAKEGQGRKGKNGCKDKQAVIANPGELNK
ncbi:hypothetical protein BDQ94DRAFT_143307 [Aspergillus welwitschiae]|uniref:Uncharacterized protein n=1 Tax=Aspergillus welwitschiae TaxID=1341132 RepID=A0A3F3Q3F6_9EURO|nr:hypothetical protein BDQ94DRAFT_143307 [Aspergillus welwitschiae]RDH33547.1 hypothetical protein BDQ94DRAFT_143307 [Aspergillus welwitschiae]